MKTIITVMMFACLARRCVGEDTPMYKLPSVAEIVNSLPKSEKLRQCTQEFIGPYFKIVKTEVIIELFKHKAVIEVLHPEQKAGAAYEGLPQYEENRAFDYLACNIIYWWCNIKAEVPIKEQMDFILKQRSNIGDYWGQIVAQTHHPRSKTLAVECLRRGIATVHIIDEIKTYPEFWGEPADFIPMDDLLQWAEEGRESLLTIAFVSKSDKFRRWIAKGMFNDPNAHIRQLTRWYVENGKLPDVKNELDAEENNKPKSSPIDKAKTKAMWLKLKQAKFPIKFAIATAQNNLPGVDKTIRNCVGKILASKAPSELLEVTVLEMALKNLDLWLSQIAGPERAYFEQLREVGVRVLEQVHRG